MRTSELKGLLNDDTLSAIERAAIQRELEELDQRVKKHHVIEHHSLPLSR